MEINKIYNTDVIEGLKSLPDNLIDCVVTSPPYNVGIDYDSWNDLLPAEEYFQWVAEWVDELYRVLKPDGRVAINIPYEVNFKKSGDGRCFIISEYSQILYDAGFQFAGLADLKEAQAHRVKLTAWGSWLSASAPYIYNPKEAVIIFYKETWKKERKGVSYFDGSPESKEEFKELVFGEWTYRAQTNGKTKANFSQDIPEKALKILTYEDDLVLDPFMGSGTTAIACKKLRRNYVGFEISKNYHAIAEKSVEDS